MAHFYGTLKGARGQASRLGTKKSDITTVAASWQGAVEVTLSHDESTGKDIASISLRPWHGAGVSHLIYEGPVGEMPEAFKPNRR